MTELGFILIQMGKKYAMKYFNKAIKVNPCAENYYYRVIARADIIKRQNAIDNFAMGKFVEDEDYEDSIFNEKQIKADIKDLSKALALDPEDTSCLRLRVPRYNYLKQYENALTDCETLLELEPENKKWHLTVAYGKHNTDKYAEAIEGIDTYLRMNDGIGDDFLYWVRGTANYELDKLNDALKDLNKGLALKETDVLYYYRGLTNYKLKHFIQAYKDIKKALELNSDIGVKSKHKTPAPIKFAISFMDRFSENKGTDTPIGLCQMKIKE